MFRGYEMSWRVSLSAILTLASCSDISVRQVDAEVGQVLISTQPIRAPIRLRYNPTTPQITSAQARIQIGSQSASTGLIGTQQVTGSDENLTYTMAVSRYAGSMQGLNCGDQPILTLV